MALVSYKQVRKERRKVAGKEVSVAVVPMLPHHGVAARFFSGLYSLLTGMKLTFGYFIRLSTVVTQQYPNNRATLRFPERYRASLKFKMEPVEKPVSAGASEVQEIPYHQCSACRNCERACPNGSIRVVTQTGEISDDRELDRFIWRMDSCMYCNACVQACSFGALEMGPEFENAVYDRRLLVFSLNRYAGPTANFVNDEEDMDLRLQMIARRDPYGGPVPLNGHALPNLRPLSITPIVDPKPAGTGNDAESEE